VRTALIDAIRSRSSTRNLRPTTVPVQDLRSRAHQNAIRMRLGSRHATCIA